MEGLEVRVYRDGDIVKVGIPAGIRDNQVALLDLLPTLQRITGEVVGAAEQREAKHARPISCQAGCGACCRQLVPISLMECLRLQALIDGMDPERRQRIASRIEEIKAVLKAAELFDKVSNLRTLGVAERNAVSYQYLGLKMACPFLEIESCSIHPDRPLICREYLVTSPAENCRAPTPSTISRVSLAASVAAGVRRLEGSKSDQALVALPLMHDVAPNAIAPLRPVREWLRELLSGLSSQKSAGSS